MLLPTCYLLNTVITWNFFGLFNLYRNDAFAARTLLAAIDHNCHLHRKALITKDGKLKYNKVFSKRSNNWRVSVVKEEKAYDYWPTITSKVLQRRKDDKGSILRSVPILEDHPKNIASSIALKPIPKTSDLVEKAISRFSKE
jgi:hypothetical protein